MQQIHLFLAGFPVGKEKTLGFKVVIYRITNITAEELKLELVKS